MSNLFMLDKPSFAKASESKKKTFQMEGLLNFYVDTHITLQTFASGELFLIAFCMLHCYHIGCKNNREAFYHQKFNENLFQ